MSQEVERVYTINLGKVWLSPNNQRAKRAINMIREFATHHMKTEQIKIDPDLSQAVWKRGIRRPPRKIRVKMAKTDEGYVLVSTYEEEEKPKTVEEKSKAKDKKKPEAPVAELEEQIEEKIEEKEKEAKVTELKKEILEPKETKEKQTKQKETKEKPKEAKPKKEETKKKSDSKEKKSEKKKPAKKSK